MNERTVNSLSNLAGLNKILCQFKLITEMNKVDKIQKLTNLNPPMANGGGGVATPEGFFLFFSSMGLWLLFETNFIFVGICQ